MSEVPLYLPGHPGRDVALSKRKVKTRMIWGSRAGVWGFGVEGVWVSVSRAKRHHPELVKNPNSSSNVFRAVSGVV